MDPTNKRGQLNPQNEELRNNSIPEPPNVEEIIQKLITIPKIHASYLFTPGGYTLLQTLCRWLSATKSTSLYGGWEDFGIKLGLDPLLIKSICNNLRCEDSTYYTLLAYVQNDDATIEQILYVLYEIKRYDILLEIKDLVKTLCETVLLNYNPNEEVEILMPELTPNCPFIFKNFDQLKIIKSKIATEKIQRSTPITTEKIQGSIPTTTEIPKRQPRLYAKTVLITYTHDADEIVQECLLQLRKPRNNLILGIVVLNEHRDKMSACPEQFIFECFSQVDYVFPIVTSQYLKYISNGAANNYSTLANPDHKYVQYIYRLMTTHYLRNGCRNTMVRCLIPDDAMIQVLNDPAMNHSLFQIWVRISEINTLLDAILK